MLPVPKAVSTGSSLQTTFLHDQYASHGANLPEGALAQDVRLAVVVKLISNVLLPQRESAGREPVLPRPRRPHGAVPRRLDGRARPGTPAPVEQARTGKHYGQRACCGDRP